MDKENELPFKVIVSFSASRFALPIPLIIIYICFLVHVLKEISLFFPFVYTNSVLDVLAVQPRWDSFTEVITSGHLVHYLCWYMFLIESVSCSRDVVCLSWKGTHAQGGTYFLYMSQLAIFRLT